MKINDLSKELGIDNKELITYLKSQGFEAKSHMQNATDEMIDSSRKHFTKEKEKSEDKENENKQKNENKVIEVTSAERKTFHPDDQIPCRSVIPWGLVKVGADNTTIYSWEYFGDVEYVAYKDLQSWRRKEIITKPQIVIDDPDLCYQWSRELEGLYKYYLGVEYPEEFFDIADTEFTDLLKTAPEALKEVIKTTALIMIRNKNYPTIQKLSIIDEILGTCLKDFL